MIIVAFQRNKRTVSPHRQLANSSIVVLFLHLFFRSAFGHHLDVFDQTFIHQFLQGSGGRYFLVRFIVFLVKSQRGIRRQGAVLPEKRSVQVVREHFQEMQQRRMRIRRDALNRTWIRRN